MLTVHHLDNSRSHRIIWLLEELGVPYQIQMHKRDKVTMLAPPSLKKIHPLGKAPTLSDGDKVIVESGAIIEYILENHGEGKLAPQKEDPSYEDFRFYMHYSEGSVMPLMVMSLVFSKLGESPAPLPIRPIGKIISLAVHAKFISPQIDLHLKFLNDQVKGKKWFLGEDFSAADIQMSFPLEAGEKRAKLKKYPHLYDLLQRMRERPAYQRAIEKGGPLNLLS